MTWKTLSNLALAERLLSFIDWHFLFVSCVSIDDYWNDFKFQCLNVICLTTPITIPFERRNIIPNFLRRAILKKRLLWRKYRHSFNIDTLNNFKVQSRLVRGLSRRHHLHRETIIMQSNDNTKFWRFCSSFTNSNQVSYPLPMICNSKSINSFLKLPDTFTNFSPLFFECQVNFPSYLYTPLLPMYLCSFQFNFRTPMYLLRL